MCSESDGWLMYSLDVMPIQSAARPEFTIQSRNRFTSICVDLLWCNRLLSFGLILRSTSVLSGCDDILSVLLKKHEDIISYPVLDACYRHIPQALCSLEPLWPTSAISSISVQSPCHEAQPQSIGLV